MLLISKESKKSNDEKWTKPKFKNLWYYRFGVCCVKILEDDSDTDVNYNDTYIQNPDYPNSYGEEGTITYKVNKIDSSK